ARLQPRLRVPGGGGARVAGAHLLVAAAALHPGDARAGRPCPGRDGPLQPRRLHRPPRPQPAYPRPRLSGLPRRRRGARDRPRHPRRLLPVLFLGTTLVVAQATASWNLRAGFVGIVIIGATVLVAPCAWRWALELPTHPAVRALRVIAFVLLGAVMIPALAFG